MFDKSEGKGQVAVSELGNFVRALNLNPTETEINEMCEKVDSKRTGYFTVEDVEKVVRERGKDKETL